MFRWVCLEWSNQVFLVENKRNSAQTERQNTFTFCQGIQPSKRKKPAAWPKAGLILKISNNPSDTETVQWMDVDLIRLELSHQRLVRPYWRLISPSSRNDWFRVVDTDRTVFCLLSFLLSLSPNYPSTEDWLSPYSYWQLKKLT